MSAATLSATGRGVYPKISRRVRPVAQYDSSHTVRGLFSNPQSPVDVIYILSLRFNVPLGTCTREGDFKQTPFETRVVVH